MKQLIWVVIAFLIIALGQSLIKPEIVMVPKPSFNSVVVEDSSVCERKSEIYFMEKWNEKCGAECPENVVNQIKVSVREFVRLCEKSYL